MGQFALSVVGRDRPGIVAEVSRVLFELGCNIEDSTCTILSLVIIFLPDGLLGFFVRRFRTQCSNS